MAVAAAVAGALRYEIQSRVRFPVGRILLSGAYYVLFPMLSRRCRVAVASLSQARASKIVAGVEPENTNIFIQVVTATATATSTLAHV